jgi:hypothetical protein
MCHTYLEYALQMQPSFILSSYGDSESGSLDI